jgi:hypothetical protein
MPAKLMGTALGAAAIAAVALVTAQPAQARFYDPSIAAAPPAAEQIACRTVRETVRRPNGRITYRTRRVCGTTYGYGGYHSCRYVRERVVRPYGSVVYRSVRRC